MPAVKKISDWIASYTLSCILFLLLFLLTYLGTMNQVEHGLYQSQQKYFESIFLVHWAFGMVPVPLPGGYLVLILTFVNLVWGTTIRLRRAWSKVGIFVAHLGMMILLAGAAISYAFSVSGHMALYEGEQSNEFESSYEWELGLREEGTIGPVTEYLIHETDFASVKEGRGRTFTFSNVPFSLTIEKYMPNAMPAGADAQHPHTAANGPLAPAPLDKDYEQNLAGMCVVARATGNGAEQRRDVWAGNMSPSMIEVEGKRWALELRRRRWQLPFAIRLDRFVHALHPGTNMPREFSSHVTKTEGGIDQPITITMNEPLRHHGYTFYQSSWGPPNAGPNARLYSVFAVVKNPADKMPLYACVVTTIGLTLHFVQKLLSYLRKERAKKS